jgi:glutamyl-tRNA reductase
LLVGAGEHGKIVARALQDYGLAEIVVANRTFERAAHLADQFNGSAIPLQEVDRFLGRVDIVLASTGSGRVLIWRDDLASALSSRRGRSLVMIDLAVPRNIDPSVNNLSGVFRFDIDDLATVASRGQDARKQAAAVAEEIVAEETERHWRRLMGDRVNRQIGGVVQRAEAVRLAEINRAQSALKGMTSEQQRTVDAMTKAIVKKILHHPLRSARQLAEDGDVDSALALFGAFDGGEESFDD